MNDFKEGDRVTTEQGEAAKIWIIHPHEPTAVLTMEDQHMEDGAVACRTVSLSSLTKVVK